MNFASKLIQMIASVPSIVSGIESLLGHRSGAEKKDTVMNFLQTALSMSDAAMSKEIVDQAAFRHGLGLIVNGVVEVLNASVWAKAKGEVQAATPPALSAQ